MNEEVVREHAEAHGQAVVKGDMRAAGGDLTKDAMAQAGPVMSSLPKALTAAEVGKIEAEGKAFVARIAYRGAEGEAIVLSRWEERDGRPMITDLQTG